MARWIALLRGINVGGKNVLPMRAVVEILEGAGYRNVRTYAQSGNVVLDGRASSANSVAARVGEAIEAGHGVRPAVVVLTATELEEAAASNPYPQAEGQPRAVHLVFLAQAPATEYAEVLERLRAPGESWALVGKVLYLHTPDGIARSKLAAGVEKALGVEATARNWRTVSKLLALARE
jgi:uncharacterized protein (DUF1697 family)